MSTRDSSTGFARKGSLVFIASASLGLVTACGGGSSSGVLDDGELSASALEDATGALLDPASPILEDGLVLPGDFATVDAFSDTAVYQVTVRNFWGPDDFPQDFPEGAHLSLFGGAIHNASVSFWQIGEPPSRGLEDIAEAGLIDVLLSDEVSPAIAQGTASSFVEVRRFTDPAIDGEPGLLEFEVTLTRNHPLITMASMLGPSPDWFVGVSGLSLLDSDDDDIGNDIGNDVGITNSEESTPWYSRLIVQSPIHDGGSKSDIIPVMGGPDIIPPDPVGFVAYDETTGVYLPSETPQIVAEFEFVRLR